MALSNSGRSTLSGIVLLQLKQQDNGKIGGRSSKNNHCYCFRPQHSLASTARQYIRSPRIVLSTNFDERHRDRSNVVISSVSQGQEETQLEVEDVGEQPQEEADDAEYVRQILRVLELLKEKRDMAFSEVRLTIMIEDPREAEQKRQLGVEDARGCTREEMAAALVDVYEGRIPKDRVVLRELANEMLNWPKLETEVVNKRNPMLSPYAKVTETGVNPKVAAQRAKVDLDAATEIPAENKKNIGDSLPPVVTEVVSKKNPMQSPYARETKTGVDPKVAAQRAKVDWDAATEISTDDEKDMDNSLPPAVGFSVLYLITGLPVIIGVTVVLVLFLNSLQ